MIARRFVPTLGVAMASAFVGGFVAVPLVVLTAEGVSILVEEPFVIFGMLFWATFGAFYAVIVATVPAILLGSLLRGLRVRHHGLWAGVGVIAGGSCFMLVSLLPTSTGEFLRTMSAPDPLSLVPAFAIAGGVAALFFRYLAELFLDFEDETGGAAA